MQDLEFGDRVAFVTSSRSESGELDVSIGIGKGTPVLAFAHRSEAGGADTFADDLSKGRPPATRGEEEIYLLYAKEDISGGIKAVEATGNHLVPVHAGGKDGGASVALIPTHDVISGTKLIVAVGAREVETATVIAIEKRRRATSLIAPLTMANSLIVDGVAFSCATEHMALSHVGQAIGLATSGARFDDAMRDTPISALLSPLWMLDRLRRASKSTLFRIMHFFM